MNTQLPETATKSETVAVLASRIDECRERLEKLQRRGKRYGQEISWTETPRTEERKYERPDGKTIVRTTELVDLHIIGSAPSCGDYVFEAALERTDGGVLIQAVPGVFAGKLAREWDGRCDHCGNERHRKYGYIVRKGRTRKVVGKSCLRDHLGMDEPASIAARFRVLAELANTGEDGWGAFGGSWGDLTESVIVASRVAIGLFGWRPSSFDGISTAMHVDILMSPPVYIKGREIHAEERRAMRAELKENGDRYEREAQAVLEWARNLKVSRSDYLHNLQVALGSDTVTSRTFNLVVSAAATFDRQKAKEDERKAQRAAELPSHHIGEAGVRMEATLKLLRTYTLPDYGYGTSTIYTFMTPEGAQVCWKTGSNPQCDGHPLERGQEYFCGFTVKSHTEYRDTPQTNVLRLKIMAAA